MRMTPLEIQNHTFSRRLSGLDPEEVKSFLELVADDYENTLRENERLKDSLHQAEKRNDELASGEKVLRETLVSAQSMAEKLRETAVAESEVLLRTAEIRAEKILDASHRRAATLAEEIRELRGLRQRFTSSLRGMIDTHIALIDRVEKDEDALIPPRTGIANPSRPDASWQQEQSAVPPLPFKATASAGEASPSQTTEKKPHAAEVTIVTGPVPFPGYP